MKAYPGGFDSKSETVDFSTGENGEVVGPTTQKDRGSKDHDLVGIEMILFTTSAVVAPTASQAAQVCQR